MKQHVIDLYILLCYCSNVNKILKCLYANLLSNISYYSLCYLYELLLLVTAEPLIANYRNSLALGIYKDP